MSTRMNWAGSYEFTAPVLVEPSSVSELAEVIRRGGPVRALGTRHSFTDLADTDGVLVSTLGMLSEIVLDADAATVTVGAGCRYGVLASWLEERGWALHNMGSLPHISIGGAVATGTHGSGDRNGVLSTAVRALEWIDHRGLLQRTRRGDEGFDGMVVGLGAYGIVTRLTLDIQPSFRVRQDVVTGVSWEAFLEEPAAVTGAAYSVSVFTRWSTPDVSEIWIKSRVESDGAPIAATLLDGRRLVEPRVIADNLTAQGGVPGPWSERLPHFRLDSVPSIGEELQTEYFVPRADAARALRAVREHAALIDPLLGITELRTASADALWLSGAYGQDVLGIHFTWFRDPEGVGRVLPVIEEALAPFGARPHWGKLHRFDADDIARVHPRAADARALFARLDPDGRFGGAHLRRRGLVL